MADKITLTEIANLENETTAVAAINSNSSIIEAAMNNTLSRDGTQPNAMAATLDMNSNPIINLPTPTSNYEPLRVIDRTTLNGGGTISVSAMPNGGTAGQVLTKNSSTNYDASWQTPLSGSSSLTTVPAFNTLADAQAALIPNTVSNITVVRKQAGWPLANAPFIRGAFNGLNAFQDGLGNWWNIDTSKKYLHAFWFWAGGGTDDTTQLQSMFNAGTGFLYDFGSGSYTINSTVNIPARSTIRGDNFDSCSISISGVVEIVGGMFQGADKTGVIIEGIAFNGNNVSTSVNSVGAIYFANDANANSDSNKDLTIRKCKFYNFKQDRWVCIENNTASTTNTANIYINDNYFSSVTGNCRDYSTYVSTMIFIWGNTVLTTGAVGDIFIQRNEAYGIGGQTFCAIWSNTGQLFIEDNVTREFSYNATGTPNNYVYLVYNSGTTQPKGGFFCRNWSFNTIWGGGYVGPACGIYCADVGPMVVNDNYFEGILRTDNVTLPRAAISMNGCRQFIARGNEIVNCWMGITQTGTADQYQWKGSSANLVSNNVITSQVGSATGIRIVIVDNGTTTSFVSVAGNVIAGSGIGGNKVVKIPGTYGTITETGTVP